MLSRAPISRPYPGIRCFSASLAFHFFAPASDTKRGQKNEAEWAGLTWYINLDCPHENAFATSNIQGIISEMSRSCNKAIPLAWMASFSGLLFSLFSSFRRWDQRQQHSFHHRRSSPGTFPGATYSHFSSLSLFLYPPGPEMKCVYASGRHARMHALDRPLLVRIFLISDDIISLYLFFFGFLSHLRIFSFSVG